MALTPEIQEQLEKLAQSMLLGNNTVVAFESLGFLVKTNTPEFQERTNRQIPALGEVFVEEQEFVLFVK